MQLDDLNGIAEKHKSSRKKIIVRTCMSAGCMSSQADVIKKNFEAEAKAQELFGYLEDDLLLFISAKLKLPPSRVYGVATFYHFFQLKPQGEHTCVVCLGTACYVKGADKIISGIQEKYKIKSGGTTADNKLSLLTARCIGACGIAPAVTYDGHVAPKQTSEMTLEKIKTWI